MDVCIVYTLLLAVLTSVTVILGKYADKVPEDTHFRLKRSTRNNEDISVRELNVLAKVAIRFADVHVHSVIENRAFDDQDVTFEVRIPKTSFIRNFWITTENMTVTAEIKSVDEAMEIYTEAQAEDETAAMVTQKTNIKDDFNKNIFSVAVNVRPRGFIEFHLEYQELLQRFAGKYRQEIYIDAYQVIPKLSVTCEIKEKEQFKSMFYTTPINEDVHTDMVETTTPDGYHQMQMAWEPTEDVQSTVDFRVVLKPFIIEYELEPADDGGYVYYSERGEFAHMFSSACDFQYVMAKQIVFVIDISGSMKGRPIAQVFHAMISILDQIRYDDYFNIVLFAKTVAVWQKNFIQATPDNVLLAKDYIKRYFTVGGATNINDALLTAIDLFTQIQSSIEVTGSSIVFLTDGEATEGVTNGEDIRRNVRMNNFLDQEKCCKSSIFTIAFGGNSDSEFLRLLAYENGGSMKIISESQEPQAIEYIVEMYETIENPYYQDVKFHFETEDGPVPEENVTETEFFQYDCGSELITGGWTRPDAEVRSEVVAVGTEGEVRFGSIPRLEVVDIDADFLAQLVVYHKLNELLRRIETIDDATELAYVKDQALQLALDHGFVTPLTSLVLRIRKADPAAFANRAGGIYIDFSTDKTRLPSMVEVTSNPNSMSGSASVHIGLLSIVAASLSIIIH